MHFRSTRSRAARNLQQLIRDSPGSARAILLVAPHRSTRLYYGNDVPTLLSALQVKHTEVVGQDAQLDQLFHDLPSFDLALQEDELDPHPTFGRTTALSPSKTKTCDERVGRRASFVAENLKGFTGASCV